MSRHTSVVNGEQMRRDVPVVENGRRSDQQGQSTTRFTVNELQSSTHLEAVLYQYLTSSGRNYHCC